MFLQFSSPPYGSCENVPESFAAPPCPPIRDSIAVITIITDLTAVTVSGHSKRCRESSGEPSGDSAGRVPESPQVRLHPPRPLPPSSLPLPHSPSPPSLSLLPFPPVAFDPSDDDDDDDGYDYGDGDSLDEYDGDMASTTTSITMTTMMVNVMMLMMRMVTRTMMTATRMIRTMMGWRKRRR